MKGPFPIDRKRMYVFLFAFNLCLRTFMYFVVSNQTLLYHTTVGVISLIEIIVLWEFILFIGIKLEKRLPLLESTFMRIIVQTLLTYGLSAVTGTLFFLLLNSLFTVNYLPEMKAIVHLVYFMLIIVINLIYFGIIYVFNWKNDLIKLANVERERAIVQYDVLKNQLNPHFLFNALTSVNSLVHSDPDLAQDFLQQLSKVYRYVLQTKEKETVSVSIELDFIKNYTSLLKTRFENAIEFNIDITEESKDKEIVPVTLQILIENAVKHNIATVARPLRVSITDDDSFLIIQNTVNRKVSVESSNCQGMGNLKSLYQFLASRSIEIIERDQTYMVKIPLI